jgi:methionyl-tRNA synthetase
MPETELISIQDFGKIDLRVAQILSADPHPNADRLLVLKIDLGPELGQRQLVAGIRAHYDPATLVGRKVIVIVNLQPAILRGVESQGMLLAAANETQVVFLTPEKDIPVGSRVR